MTGPQHRPRVGGRGRPRTVPLLLVVLAVLVSACSSNGADDAVASAGRSVASPGAPSAPSATAAAGPGQAPAADGVTSAPIAPGPPTTQAGLPGAAGEGSVTSAPSASGTEPAPAPAASGSTSATLSPPPAGACQRPATSGAAPTVDVTRVDLPAPVVGYGGEGDTEPLPMALAARPTGDSWLAWLGTDRKVHVGRLGCDDRLAGAAVDLEGIDLQDIEADAGGAVVLLTRQGNCGNGPLCGGSSTPCRTMWMVRLDNSGRVQWEREVTNLSGANLAGYDDGARFVWWYQHHGRLATDGSNWAAYFGVAITVRNGGCVDVHEGDRMQVVDRAGAPVPDHPDSFAVGCSHSWGTRMVWDDRTGHFVMVCATDNNCRIAQPDPYRTVAAGACDGTLFGGDLVLAPSSGYWVAWSQGGQVRLDRFTTGASEASVRPGVGARNPHLVRFGGRMLLAWESGGAMSAQVLDAGTGRAVGERFAVPVPDHSFQAFKAYADGSAAYPAAGATAGTAQIARVRPWSG